MDSKLVGLALPLLLLFAVLDSGDAIMMPRAKKKVTDQQTSASFWSSNVTGTAAETHPELGVKRPSRKKNTLGASSSFMHLDFNTSATAELQTNLFLSLPDQCYRPCKAGDPPKMCYYQFTLEYYTVLGGACTRNGSNTQWLPTQCVRADGVEKGILTVNRMIPGPSIQVCKGDKVIIDVENHMEGMEVTIHWHGITQKGSQYYDGVPFITQCPIQQGNTFRYQWIASNAGTHFWHSHTGIQKIDGIHGSLIIREPPANDPNSHLYDEDLKTHVIFLSDWMHEVAAERYPGRRTNNTGQAPDNILINGKGQFSNPKTGFTTNTPLEVFTMTPGKRYRFRMINSFCTVCPAELKIQGHDLNLIAADGEPVLPVKVKTIISFSGERYDFVINADRAIGAYWIQVRGLGECREKKIQQLAILKYENGTDQPTTPKPSYNDSVIPEGVVSIPASSMYK